MKNKMRIRADGNSQLGLGHVIRCLALATILNEKFVIKFYLCNADETIKSLLENKGFEVKVIVNEEIFFSEIKKTEIVVLDGYTFDTAYQKKVKDLDAILVCIDDLHSKHFLADVIINHAPDSREDMYEAESYTKFLLGPKYALLRPAFQRQAAAARWIQKTNKVLVCFGGSDAKNLTISTLNILIQDTRFSSITVITGNAYPYLNQLTEIISKHIKVSHYHNIHEDKIIKLLTDVQLAIIPASGILFEVIACKTPAISGYYVDNQVNIYKGFLQLGTFYNADNFAPASVLQAIEKAFESDPNEMIKKQAACIDGKSAERYLEFFTNLRYEHSTPC